MNPLPVIVLALVGYGLVHSARKTLTTDRAQILGVVRAFRWRYFPGTLAALAGVIVVAGTLDTFLPWTRWGWWHLLGGRGNPVLGEVDLGSSVYGLGLSTILAVTFPLLLAVAAIREARAEEVSFRKGNQKLTLRRRAARAIWFGLVHCLIGIPIYAGVALAVTGAWLDFIYQLGYDRVAAQGSQADARWTLLGALRARQIQLTLQATVDERKAAEDEQWASSYACGEVVYPPVSNSLLQALKEEEQTAATAGSHAAVDFLVAERLQALNHRAEEAGVDAAAAQHAFYNLLLIVLIEVVVLQSLGVF